MNSFLNQSEGRKTQLEDRGEPGLVNPQPAALASAEDGPSAFNPALTRETRKNSWLVALDWPTSSYCSHLGSEPLGWKISLLLCPPSPSVTLFLNKNK